MPKVTDITVLNIDETPYAVESLTDEIIALVDVYNEWNRKEADVRDELTRFQAAKETLSRQIIGKVREHIAEDDDSEEVVETAPAANAQPEVVEMTDASDPDDLVVVN